MSREYLNDVLNKFAQVTTVLVETSKIKEYLDNNCKTNEDLKIVLERTKAEVENLCEHSVTVKDLFYEQYKEVSAQLNCLNGEKTDELDCKVDSDGTPQATKPLIKLVDINKLVEPKTLLNLLKPAATHKQKKSVDLESTVVIITSSDEEPPKSTRNKVEPPKTLRKSRTSGPVSRVRREAARETIKKTKLALQVRTSSDTESSDSERVNTQTRSVKNGNRRKAKLDQKITLSDASDISDVTNRSSKGSNKKKKKVSKEIPEPDWKKDAKFKSKCYVQVLRVPCDKLKEYYLEKLELLEVKKLSNMKALKRKRGKKSGSEKSSDSEDKEAKKKKSDSKKSDGKDKEAKKKETKKASEAEKDKEASGTSDSDHVGSPKSKEHFSDSETPELLLQNESDQAAELALGLLNSDKEDDKETSADEEEATNKEKEALTEDSTKQLEETVPKEKEVEKIADPDANKEEAGNEEKDKEAETTKEASDKGKDEAELDLGLLNSDKEASADEEEATNKEKEAPTEDSIKQLEKTVPEEKEKEAEKIADLDANKEEAGNEEKDKEAETTEEASDKEKDEAEQTKYASDKEDDETDKTKDTSDKEADKNEDASDKDDETDKTKDASDKEDEDAEKKKNKDKAKKAWRKDKLLTQRLSSSDSEEEFEKFCKKKNKMKEEVASDEEPKLPRDKKRLMKKRIKKSLLIDSDSDNKKNSDDEFQKTSSSSSSSESEKENEKKSKEEEIKPVRKRVKRVKDSSDEDDDEKSTRKQIRNIWGRDTLAETTKKAEAEERERKARIAEKQKKYNQLYEGTFNLNAKVDKVVLDFDEKNNKEILRVDDDLVKKLKPHQASGIQFMWDACFESLERTQSTTGSGCILAHCMGLGKTLQVIALSHTLLTNEPETGIKKVMVVSPLNTVLNWVSEYKMWLPDLDEYEIYELVSFKQNYERLYQIKNWHNCGGVLIIGYDMFRNLSNPENKRISKKMRNKFQETLVDPGPDLVICDEGHLLKNEKTNLSIAMNRLKTLRRIVLTGTPLQNNLKEYFCMVQFVKPNLLGTYKEYLNRFVNPITNGQYTDSTPHDIQIMRKRSHVLHKMLDGIVQRRDYSVLQPYLPPKHEYVLFLNLTEVQIKLYRHYMDHFARRSTDGSNRTSFLFVDFQSFQRICTHPRVLLDKSIQIKNAREKAGLSDEEEDSEGSLKNFIDDDEEESAHSTSSDDDDDDESGEEKKKKKKSNASNRTRVTRAAAAAAKENGDEVPLIEITNDPESNLITKREWWQEYCDGDALNVISHSNKLFLLFEILRECEQIGDKVLVFSQSLYSLNIIEYFLGLIHDNTQDGNTDSVESWCLGLDYFRLDGSSSCDNRTAWCKTFNDPSNTRARLFLISTKAGGLGINLVAANRVVIFDVSWNPSHDVQSIYRVYRFGQTKPTYVYRFVTHGTMEMTIYERQVIKQAISKRVIDEQQIDRHYNQNDLAELYKFDPNPENRPIPLVPKDVLLGELLQKFEDKIFNYHEHQSLLENKEDEGLNEEERKAAWEEFENEKKQRHNMNLATSNYLRQNTNIELAMIRIIRKENPTWTDAQVKALVPTLQIQLHNEIALGDLRLYRKVQQEIQILQALQNQKLTEQFYQQQALRLLQQQKMAPTMSFNNTGSYMDQFVNQMPGTSRGNLATSQAKTVNSNEVIDLND